MIEQIEDVCAELEIVPLAEMKCFDEREVPVRLPRSTISIARGSSPSGRARPRRVRRSRRRSKAGGVKIVGQNGRGRARGIGRLGSATSSGGAQGRSKQAATGAVRHRERQSALVRNNSADGPAFEDLVVKEAAPRHWKVVGIAHHQAVGPIKVTAGPILSRVGLIVVNVRAVLAGARGIQLVRAQASTDVVHVPRVGVGSLEIQTPMQTP